MAETPCLSAALVGECRPWAEGFGSYPKTSPNNSFTSRLSISDVVIQNHAHFALLGRLVILLSS